MAVTFTPDQQRVIDTRNKNILVSAAAGSGKTAVLVERIIKRVTDEKHPMDIDRLLVVTFTNAAAAEMKERIGNAIQARLAEEPANVHLQRQAVLVHQAQITTIHSFCLYLIKNHFEAIDLEPDFTVADEAAVKLLAAECKAEILEEAFAEAEEDFLYMVEIFCHNGKESVLEEYIDQLYARAMSMPFPASWLLERGKDYDFADLEAFTDTDSGRFLLTHILGLIKSYRDAYEKLYRTAVEPDGPYMYADVLEQEKDYLERILRKDNLADIGALLSNMDFARLPAKKDDSVNADKKEWVKERRTAYKKALQELAAQFFGKSPQSILVENAACKRAADALVKLTLTYMERLTAEKRKKGIIDFNDMEHMALQILLKETPEGFEPTEIARSYQEFYEEVMIDEYQDSNMVQEYLVTAVSGEESGKYNRFMVGDVKQSIYKFRLARPELFMEKYHAYVQKGYDTCVRIDLKQNFRSRQEVLTATNYVFERVMTPDLGGIAYDESAALYPGAQYPGGGEWTAELLLAAGDKPEHYDAKEWEAYCVARRIKELLRTGTISDSSRQGLRPITYGDIVLLFRSPSGFEEAYKKVFAEQGIPMYMTSGNGYFDAIEIQQLVKFLQAIENPRLDIPMFGVCTSLFGGMEESQLARVKIYYMEQLKKADAARPNAMSENSEKENTTEREDGEWKISSQKGEQCLYDMLRIYAHAFPEDTTGIAITKLLAQLRKYRKYSEYMTVSELIYEILREYQYREYMSVLPDGAKRLSNISLLLEKAAGFGTKSFQGLFAFTSYINQLKKQAIDMGEAGGQEQGNAVRVMSIHKSKGLEFPVAFVCGMGQRYQMRDKQQMLLIDNDMGLGMDYVNPTLRSKNKTLRKNAIALKMEQEILAEEQRILYVAMTRAKEKLIMAGYIEDAETAERMISAGGSEHARVSTSAFADTDVLKRVGTAEIPGKVCENIAGNHILLSDILAARSYLDLCLLAWGKDCPITPRIMTTEDYAEAEIIETVTRQERQNMLWEYLEFEGVVRQRTELGEAMVHKSSTIQTEEQEAFEKACLERFHYPYPYENLRDLYAKTSVSELKKASIAEEQEAVFEAFEKANAEEIMPYIPDFIQEKTEVKGAERGTAYHRVLELLDFAKAPKQPREWHAWLERRVMEGKMSERQKDCIYVPKMQEFMQSDLAKRMKNAALQGFLQKERSFFLGVPANRVNPRFPEEEMMLVQGIVDAYFEEGDGLVLVDYKTDYVKESTELAERYRVQMQYYAEALEKSLGKPVKEVILYSFAVGREISM